MKTVLVFKTSVTGRSEVNTLKPQLNQLINANERWNFDLEDCDNILRVETFSTQARAIKDTLQQQGFLCEELI